MLSEDVTRRLAAELALPHQAVAIAGDRIEQGQSPSYLARYAFSEIQLGERPLRDLQRVIRLYHEFESRRQTIRDNFESRGLLDEGVSEALARCGSLRDLDDFFSPLRPGKDGPPRKMVLGVLDPLAKDLLAGRVASDQIDERLTPFVRESGATNSVDAEANTGDVEATASESTPVESESDPDGEASSESATPDVASRVTGDATPGRRPFGSLDEARRVLKEAVSVRAMLDLELRRALRETFWDRAILHGQLADELAHDGDRADGDASDHRSENTHDENAHDSEASTSQTTDEADNDDASAVDAEHGSESDHVAGEERDNPSGETASSEGVADPSATEAPSGSEETAPANNSPAAEAAAAPTRAPISGTPFPPSSIGAGAKPSAAAEQRRAAKKARRKRIIEGYQRYFDFQSPLTSMQEHAWLELHRGQQNNVLRTSFTVDRAALSELIEQGFQLSRNPASDYLRPILDEALDTRLIPQLERDARRHLSEGAERLGFETQLRTLESWLAQPPLIGDQVASKILVVDPGRRAGWAVVVLNGDGTVVDHAVVTLQGRQEQTETGRESLKRLVTEHRPTLVVVAAHGVWRDAERHTMSLVREHVSSEAGYLLAHPAGAWDYAISAAGKEDLPRLDPSLRAAVALGRRVLDPLRELSKVAPKDYAVGLQHEGLLTSAFREWLDDVLPSLVGLVGVDVNTAPASLLRQVPGLDSVLAVRIVERRTEKGPFRTRQELRELPGMNDAVWNQAAGLLRIADSPEPLDRTWIHPAQYELAVRLLDLLQIPLTEVLPPIATPAAPRRAFAGVVEGDDGDVPATPADATGAEPSTEPTSESQVSSSSIEPTDASASADGASPQPGDSAAEPVAMESEESAQSESTPMEPAHSEPVLTEPLSAALSESGVDVERTDSMPTPASSEPSASPTPESAPVNSDVLKAFRQADPFELARTLDVDPVTIAYLLQQLAEPGSDPRRRLPTPPISRQSGEVTTLRPGMLVVGQVRKLLDFGAFVDLGDGRQALLPVGQLTATFVKHPSELLRMGDVLLMWISKVDPERGQLTVTTRPPDLLGRLAPVQPPRPPRDARSGGDRGRPPRPGRGPGRGGEGEAAMSEAGARTGGRPGGGGGPRGGSAGGRFEGGRGDGGRGRGPSGGRGRPSPTGPGGGRPAGPTGDPAGRGPRSTFRPSANLTPDMEKGKEPMRSFADLKQLLQKRTDDDKKDD